MILGWDDVAKRVDEVQLGLEYFCGLILALDLLVLGYKILV